MSGRTTSLLLAAALIVGLLVPFAGAPAARASASGVVISQVYGGGGNSGATYKNDFIELYNAGTSAVDIGGWSVQYASAAGSTWQVTNLGAASYMLQPGQYFLVQEAAGAGGTVNLPTPDASGNIPMSATNGKVALVNGQTVLTGTCPTAGVGDFVGYGTANCSETAPTPALSNTTAALRKGGGAQDTDNNSADFDIGAPTPRNSSYPFSGAGSAVPGAVLPGQTSLLKVAVTPAVGGTGITVTCDLGAIGGSATQSFFDDGTNGDTAAGDNVFAYLATVASNTPGGTKTLNCTVADAQSRIVIATISLDVITILPIGTVQGPVSDTDNGILVRSPFAPPSGNGNGQTVYVQGVIYETVRQAASTPGTYYNAFFIQNTAATADGDPNTSDGLYVFMSSNQTLSGPNGQQYTPSVGDEVVVSGKVSEYFYMTELTGPALAAPVLRSGVIIDNEVPAVVANPAASLADANRYWERLESMRVQVPQNSVVLGGRNVFSPADAEIWVAAPDSTVGQRTGYDRRAFRDAHPLDDNYDPANWDGNGYRILMGSLGIKSAAGDAQALIDPARTFDTVTSAPAGGLNYTFSKYRIELAGQPTFAHGGPDPAQNNPPQVSEHSTAYSIVDYNLENLYDYRDNPFSACDFNGAGNARCTAVYPFVGDVRSPYNYVPADDAAYQARLTDIATQIINDLHSPDILMLQEVENQDYCSVTGGAVTCGATDNADGKPDVLEDLALKIAGMGGPAYDSAFDRDSSDLRGILPAYLYRTDRVQLLDPADDPVLGASPTIGSYAPVPNNANVSNPKTLNAVLPTLPPGESACETSWVFPRAVSVGLFRIYTVGVGVGAYHDVYVLNNHFKSGPDTCVAHRTEQAKYNAALVSFIEAAKPGVRIALGGDLNVYPRPDDPFAPIGQPTASDQLGSLYDPSLGLKNLWEVILSQAPEAAYSYVYVGMAQTLDQMFVNQAMLADLEQFRIAHINSDFPADYPDDVARGTSDHDPNAGVFTIHYTFNGFFPAIANPPATNTVKAGSTVAVKFSLAGYQGLNIFETGYPKFQQVACDSGAPIGDAIEASPSGQSTLTYDAAVDQYVYTWKTGKAWGGSCGQLIVRLEDGTDHVANFSFTK